MKQMPSIEDLRQRARRNVPKMFFDYADAGSYNQETLRANRSDMERIKLRQRVLVRRRPAQHRDHHPRRERCRCRSRSGRSGSAA